MRAVSERPACIAYEVEITLELTFPVVSQQLNGLLHDLLGFYIRHSPCKCKFWPLVLSRAEQHLQTLLDFVHGLLCSIGVVKQVLPDNQAV